MRARTVKLEFWLKDAKYAILRQLCNSAPKDKMIKENVVNKIKSFVKKIIGRGNTTPYTIDLVQRTASGFCIIGWYLVDEVRNIEVSAKNGNPVETSILNIARDDVFEATGRKAKGFELHVYTNESTDSFIFRAQTNQGLFEGAIPHAESDTIDGSENSKVASTTPSKSGVKAACEHAIETSTHFFIGGWVLDNKQAEKFSIVDEKGITIANFVDGIRIQRQDVIDAFGDNAAARISGLNYLFKKTTDCPIETNSKTLKLTFSLDDTSINVPIDNIYSAAQDSITNAKRILNAWQPNARSHMQKSDMYYTALQGTFPTTSSPVVTKYNFNQQPINPVASIIIPLYGRYDFMRYQLSHFGRSDQTKNCEVIYVVDDPKITNSVMKLAREMEVISQQPFSVLLLSRNVGYGRANNIGVEHASANMIALMNSDILPKSKDWLEKLLETAGSEEVGIVGARLLFEDESIQHDGMAPMTISEYPGLLFNDHPKKGWPKSLAPYEEKVSPCPLVTAACWVMQKTLYEKLDGFAPEYVLGDFEDSDLCLRMLEIGRTNYIRRDVELYHLERQSQNLVQPGRWKHNITILNAVHFNKKWKTVLEAMEKVNS